METLVQFFPLCILLLCDILYVLEDRLIKPQWFYNTAVALLHIYLIIYFLYTEASIEAVLLFLLASLAAAVTINAPKNKLQENLQENQK